MSSLIDLPGKESTDGGDLLLPGERDTAMEAHRQATEDLQAELTESHERYRELDRWCSELSERLERAAMEAELEKLQAVQEEQQKWEAREERLVQQL